MTRVENVWDRAADRIARGDSELDVLACLLVSVVSHLSELGGPEQILSSLAMVEREVRDDWTTGATH